MLGTGKPTRAIRPDAQAFDRIEIVTVPRYKTSGMSGDEWRISAVMRFYRKGRLIHEAGCRNVETATQLLGYEYLHATDQGLGYFAGEEDLCDQEGCAEKATVVYRIKKQFARENPHEWNKELPKMGEVLDGWRTPELRMFCQKHSKRGDCGFDDADENYELVSGTPGKPNPEDVKQSGTVIVDAKEFFK